MAEAVAGCALACREDLEEGPAVKVLCVDADDGAEDVRTLLEDHLILVHKIDEVHGTAIYATEAGQRLQIQCHKNFRDEFGGEQVKLSGRMHWLTVVPSIVQGTANFEPAIIQGVKEGLSLAVSVSLEVIWNGMCCIHDGEGSKPGGKRC
jgi:hypothetical protein